MQNTIKCGKIQTTKTPYLDTFHAVNESNLTEIFTRKHYFQIKR